MALYTWIVWLHVLGAVGIGATVLVEWVITPLFEQADTWEGLERALAAFRRVPMFAAPSTIGLLASGLYMAGTRWGWGVAWIDAAFGLLVATALVGGFFTGRHMMTLGRAVARHREDGMEPLPRAYTPAMRASRLLRGALLAGALLLMVLKPDPAGVVVIVVGAPLAGLAVASLPLRWRPLHP